MTLDTLSLLIGFAGSILGSGLIQFFITRKDTKEDKLSGIIKKQETAEKDLLRIQLLVMMNLMPTHTEEIMKLAQKYFDELEGD